MQLLQDKSKLALIIINVVVFVVILAINYQSRTVSDLFPKSTGDVSDKFSTEITPASSTFSLWAFIYTFQTAWIIYTLTLICRNAPVILSNWFYIFYILANFCNFSWLLVWAREYTALSFAILALTGISLETTLFFAYKNLDDYLKEFPNQQEVPSVADVWCIRILVQNGIIFYTTWVSIATCLNLTIFLRYDLEINGSKAATGALCALLTLIVVWFVLENFILEKYVRFTFMEYIVLIVGLSGIIKKNWTDGSGNQAFVLFLLVLSSVLLVVRLLMIAFKERKGYRNEENLKLIVRDC